MKHFFSSPICVPSLYLFLEDLKVDRCFDDDFPPLMGSRSFIVCVSCSPLSFKQKGILLLFQALHGTHVQLVDKETGSAHPLWLPLALCRRQQRQWPCQDIPPGVLVLLYSSPKPPQIKRNLIPQPKRDLLDCSLSEADPRHDGVTERDVCSVLSFN